MEGCKICTGTFHNSPDKMLLCKHKDGMVHMGCCTNRCSMDGKPCTNMMAMFSKVTQ